jgi:ParB-like chromosome segregation protein Spo0J
MSKWRDHYKVHPAADAIPSMSEDELANLTADIKAHGLRVPITMVPRPGEYDRRGNQVYYLADGRHRIEALELPASAPNASIGIRTRLSGTRSRTS